MYTRILLPIDGAPSSFSAAQHARDLLAMNPSARLTILFIRQNPDRAYHAYRWIEMEVPVSEEVKRRICEAEEAILTSVETIFTDAGLVTDTDVVQGMPAEQISLYAEKGGYDLIVMGRPNAGKTPGFFSKDVIDQVLHTVKCPVLIVQG